MQYIFRRNNLKKRYFKRGNAWSATFDYSLEGNNMNASIEFDLERKTYLKVQSEGFEHDFQIANRYNSVTGLKRKDPDGDWEKFQNMTIDGIDYTKCQKGYFVLDNQKVSFYSTFKNIDGGKFLQGGYNYWEFDFEGDNYKAYSIGQGSKGGIFLCIYKNDEMIAEVELEKKAIDYENIYHIYIENKEDLEFVCIFTWIWDYNEFFIEGGPSSLVHTSSETTKDLETLHNELNGKFNAEFIKRNKRKIEYQEDDEISKLYKDVF